VGFVLRGQQLVKGGVQEKGRNSRGHMSGNSLFIVRLNLVRSKEGGLPAFRGVYRKKGKRGEGMGANWKMARLAMGEICCDYSIEGEDNAPPPERTRVMGKNFEHG